MSIEVEALFTSALGLQRPWVVESVKLDTAKRRIDFEVSCQDAKLVCPHCGAADQMVHDRLRRSWRHLDFFQFEAWMHADVPRVACTACGKTTQTPVPWAREGSGFTLLFEALGLTLCQGLLVRQAAHMLRVQDKQLWRRIEHYVSKARHLQDMSQVKLVGIDETSLRKGHEYITVVHDLDEKRLLFATSGKDHKTLQAFAQDLQAHGGEPTAIAHACMDMSAAYAKGAALYLPNAKISYDRFHVVALANEAMDEVRSAEWKTESAKVREALGEMDAKERKTLLWATRRNPSSWSATQISAMHWLQRANLKTTRAWRLKMALRAVFASARTHNQAEQASMDLKAWISWARRSRLVAFKRLGKTLKTHFDAVVRGMLDHRSNAFVEAMNGLLQQAKRAARGFRTAACFINIAYLRMGKLTHLPVSPFAPAASRQS
ncbi:MAG: ISL3 family transposase [Ideonella sp.]|nr:ISL3 family transposase [Ideonella sp.]